MCVFFLWIITNSEGLYGVNFTREYAVASFFFAVVEWYCQIYYHRWYPEWSNLGILYFCFCGPRYFMILILGSRVGDVYIPGCICVMAWFDWVMLAFWTGISQSPSVRFLVPSNTISFSFIAMSSFYLKIHHNYRHTVVLLIWGMRWWVLVVSLLSMQLSTILLIMAICFFLVPEIFSPFSITISLRTCLSCSCQ